MPQHSPNSLELRRQLRQLLLDGLRHPLHHRRHRGRRGGGIAAARRDAKGTPCNATADNLTVRSRSTTAGELKHSGPGGLRRADPRATASTSGIGGRR